MNRYAIVTGVSSGIGECIAKKFIESGIHVFGIDVNIPNNNDIEFFKCDIRDENEIINIMKRIKSKTDYIDFLINVAGIFCDSERALIENLSTDEWHNVIGVNLTGTFLITKYAIPLLKKSHNGNIINLSSEQVIMPQVKSAPYAISKAGVEMLSKILAVELIEDKIRVNTIALASVKTNFLKKYKKDENVLNHIMEETNKKMPFGIIKPNDVYKLVKYLIEDDNKITGQTLVIDSGVIIDSLIKKKDK